MAQKILKGQFERLDTKAHSLFSDGPQGMAGGILGALAGKELAQFDLFGAGNLWALEGYRHRIGSEEYPERRILCCFSVKEFGWDDSTKEEAESSYFLIAAMCSY